MWIGIVGGSVILLISGAFLCMEHFKTASVRVTQDADKRSVGNIKRFSGNVTELSIDEK